MDSKSGAELLEQCVARGMTISEVMRQRECDLTGVSVENMEARMKDVLAVMRGSTTLSLEEPVTSIGNLIDRESTRMGEWRREGISILGDVLSRAVIYAVAVLRINTSMGLIVTVPAVGSSGIVPGLLLALQEEYGLGDDLVADSLFAVSAIGYLAMRSATVSGAIGKCQAEMGVACAVTAAAAVELMEETLAQSLNAASTALVSPLGLICDPVGGLVEYPCQSRSGAGAANTLVCAETAFGGIRQLIPFDEILEAMYAVGRGLPLELRETALDDCAATPSGCRVGCYVQKT